MFFIFFWEIGGEVSSSGYCFLSVFILVFFIISWGWLRLFRGGYIDERFLV